MWTDDIELAQWLFREAFLCMINSPGTSCQINKCLNLQKEKKEKFQRMMLERRFTYI